MSLRPIAEVAAELGLAQDALIPWGRDAAKIGLSAVPPAGAPGGKLVLVSALSPTGGGEGKTTVSVGLAMGLARIGRRGALCLRQPSQGPVFGRKGGGTGGGVAQVEPADSINLHFTGDLHAVGAAHNLLAALCDSELHFGGSLDPRRTTWPRVVDVNDRALRHVVIGLGGADGGVPRESRFDITPASEVMAALCLSDSLDDLGARLGKIVVGRTRDDHPVSAADLRAAPAMLALLRDALSPNLVQTREGTPAFVHGGPFANIAHGASSVVATRVALSAADVVVTEAGFGFDLGGEKFLHLVAPALGRPPDVLVLVVTLRALHVHGGGAPGELDRAAIERGLEHLDHHVKGARAFRLEPLLAVNEFPGDPPDLFRLVKSHVVRRGVPVARVTSFVDGGEGARALAELVASRIDGVARPAALPLYAADAPFVEKLERVATTLYAASGVVLTDAARRDLARFERWGFGALPPCVAKTPASLSDDPTLLGVPRGRPLTVTGLRLA
ncbi:MAG: formate--tetrahydrofolate ligase, partial [Deltaproteobacteria bacterium]|nr:formate--tetrahydrofolate ligase [Deltaproteobacteria bacterium]